ncbi:zinc ribbon domain-containing protein [Lacrimispora amygdalina]|uniref:zinc ribbon domain-containing protein n=1 Tax=Lacrimispora amygdalina TaxID=253257 RepID=UPI000BE36A73|nr:zinc ribbon domain-containing protein [Lacrimispora amygdalina]
MNLEEIKKQIDFIYENTPDYSRKGKEVVITLNESSIGARACTSVKLIYPGFDWEAGQIRIEPETLIVSQKKNYIDIMNIIHRDTFDGKSRVYVCPRCDGKINKSDKFCRYCGQKLG